MRPALRVEPGTPARITERDARDTLGLDKARRKELLRKLNTNVDELERLDPQLPEAEPGIEGLVVE